MIFAVAVFVDPLSERILITDPSSTELLSAGTHESMMPAAPAAMVMVCVMAVPPSTDKVRTAVPVVVASVTENALMIYPASGAITNATFSSASALEMSGMIAFKV